VIEPRAKARFPRRIRPGIRPRAEEGSQLTCLVLFAGSDEWVGVDLRSGALLRSRRGEASRLRVANNAEGDHRLARFDVVALEVGRDDDPIDPARPEAIASAGPPQYLGRPSPRRVRRLLSELAAPERAGASLLSTWGPSVAYVDLDGSSQSVAIVATSPRQLALTESESGSPVAVVTWSGTTQSMPVVDPVARRALAGADGALSKSELVEALGFRPSYLVCALGAVRNGHAPKLVLSVLPSRFPRNLGKRIHSLLWEGTSGEVLGHRPAEGNKGVPT